MSDAHVENEAKTSRRAGYTLAVLFVVYIFNFVDRQILSVLLVPIKAELGVSDTAMGFLTGFAFALFYTTAGIPIARLADRTSRTHIIAIGLVVWSGMTAASGLARSFVQLALARVLVGVGEAAASPAAHSLISDYFPPARRATALAIYTMGANVGILLGLAGGGWLAQYFGWRAAFYVVGLPGLLMAVVVWLTLEEPPRGAADARVADAEAMPSTFEVLEHLWRLPSFRHLTLAGGIYALAGYGFMTWVPAFLARVHGLSTGEAGTWAGIMIGGGGALGAFIGGQLCDRLSPRDVRWQMWVPALGGLLIVPFGLGFVLLDDVRLALLFYAPAAVAGSFYVGPTFAVTQALARLRMRALAAAIVLFVLNLVGLGLGPVAIGFANDMLAPTLGDDAVRYSLAVALLTNLWAVMHSFRATRTLQADLERVAAA